MYWITMNNNVFILRDFHIVSINYSNLNETMVLTGHLHTENDIGM